MPEGTEIERKWLVEAPPGEALAAHPQPIEQGYLVIGVDGDQVRLRRRAGSCSLTYKRSRRGGLARTELEISLTEEQFGVLWPATQGRRVVKTRRVISLAQGPDDLVLELDEYGGPLTGLLTAEVEFPDEDRARGFEPPAWLGREVTGEPAYGNLQLAISGLPKRLS